MTDNHEYRIDVATEVAYLADQSDPDKSQYVFAYTMKVTNAGSVPAKLIGRHWFITDADQKVQEVKGLGVVGQQPLLAPGESFEYTSGTSIPTQVGTRAYQMVAADGHTFDAEIPQFTLSVPRTLH